MDQLAKLKDLPHRRKCNGCHQMFSSDELAIDNPRTDFICINCNNDRYWIEEDTHQTCNVCNKLTYNDDLGEYANGFRVCGQCYRLWINVYRKRYR